MKQNCRNGAGHTVIEMNANETWLHAQASLFAAIACIVLVGSSVSCLNDIQESFYPSIADADKDGAIERGWIPNFLPKSSHDIHELHDLSPSKEWCAFEFVPADSQGLRKRLESTQSQPKLNIVPSPGVSWWPDILTGKLDEKKISNAGFSLYVFEVPATSVTTAVYIFAVDWSRGRAFFYYK